FGLALLLAPDLGWVADAELQHLHAGELRGNEVSQLVDHHQDDEDAYKRQNAREQYVQLRVSIQVRANRRPQASASIIVARSQASRLSCASIASASRAGMSIKPISLCKNPATAASSAAATAAGYVPPL